MVELRLWLSPATKLERWVGAALDAGCKYLGGMEIRMHVVEFYLFISDF